MSLCDLQKALRRFADVSMNTRAEKNVRMRTSRLAIVRARNVAFQIHSVMKQSQDVDRPRPPLLGYSKQKEVPPWPVTACNVKGEQTLPDLQPLLHPDRGGPVVQCLKRRSYCVRVNDSLLVAKLIESPIDDVPEVGLRSG